MLFAFPGCLHEGKNRRTIDAMSCGGETDLGVWAAWAQAVLSALAIFVSTYVAAKVANLPALTTRHQRLSALLGIVRSHYHMLKEASEAADDHDVEEARPLYFDSSRLDRALKSLEGLPLTEYSADAIDGLFRLQADIVSVKNEIAALRAADEVRAGEALTDQQRTDMHSRTLQIRAAAESADHVVPSIEEDVTVAALAAKHWLRPFDPDLIRVELGYAWLRLMGGVRRAFAGRRPQV